MCSCDVFVSNSYTSALLLTLPYCVSFRYAVICSAGEYRIVAQSGRCADCPAGATCSGGNKLPEALPGYIQMQVTNVSSALAGGAGVVGSTTGVLRFLACTPASACQGSGKCAVGYETPENSCVGCIQGYYRLSGECVRCPDLAGLFLVLYIGVVVVFGIFGLLLVKKGPSIAVTGIGVDYYQVLSIFISFDIKVWNSFCLTTVVYCCV